MLGLSYIIRKVFEVHYEIDSVCLYHDFQTNSWALFYPTFLMSYINGFVSTSLQTNSKSFFYFKFVLDLLTENRKKNNQTNSEA